MDAVYEIDWHYLDGAIRGAVRIGDAVSSAAGGMPIYRVMALGNGRAWLRDEMTNADRVMPLNSFHWKACPHQD